MYALVDVNSFYASCEMVFRPDLQGKPVVVLSNNDGCVIARSAEAKSVGIKMGEPYFKQKDLFRRYGITCFSSNYELYADMSNRVMSILEELSPRVEIYSIDEAFCDVTGVQNYRDLTGFGTEIRQTIRQKTRLYVGVGIAPTKTLAKLANYAAKRWADRTGGVVDLSCVERQQKLMVRVPVGEVWGIGRRISKKLEAMGVVNALQLAQTDIRFIRKHFSVVMERTVRELRGESCLALEEFAARSRKLFALAPLASASPTTSRCARPYAAMQCVPRKSFVKNTSIAAISLFLLKPAPLPLTKNITATVPRYSCRHPPRTAGILSTRRYIAWSPSGVKDAVIRKRASCWGIFSARG